MSVTCQRIQETGFGKAQAACQFAKNEAIQGAVCQAQIRAIQAGCARKNACPTLNIRIKGRILEDGVRGLRDGYVGRQIVRAGGQVQREPTEKADVSGLNGQGFRQELVVLLVGERRFAGRSAIECTA